MSKLDHLSLITSSGFPDYELLDAGRGRKLERFGSVVVDRPESQALWKPALSAEQWARASAVFSASGDDDEKGRWRIDKPVPDTWPVVIPLCPKDLRGQGDRIVMHCKFAGLWHLGLFPEQQPHWQWMLDAVSRIKRETPRVLNLFGYTGAATLLAAKAGAEVTHVDASKKAVAWGRENQAASTLDAAKIRWIVDDAKKFVAREVRRGKTYHVVVVDPPKFGRGPDGEVWDLFSDLPELLDNCAKLLVPAPDAAAVVLTVYAIRASALAFDQLMRDALAQSGGTFDSGELAIEGTSGRRVPTSLFVRWSRSP